MSEVNQRSDLFVNHNAEADGPFLETCPVNLRVVGLVNLFANTLGEA